MSLVHSHCTRTSRLRVVIDPRPKMEVSSTGMNSSWIPQLRMSMSENSSKLALPLDAELEMKRVGQRYATT